MAQIKRMTYTKDNGEASTSDVIVVSAPRENYLVYDVSKLDEKLQGWLIKYLEEIEQYREDTFAELTSLTGIRQSNLWRSFKPEGIEWDKGNEI